MSAQPVLLFESQSRTRKVTPEPITIDGEIYAIIRPKEAMIMQLARAATADDVAAGARIVLDFLDSCFDEASQKRLAARLRDPHDGFDVADLTDLAYALLEHWGFDVPEDGNRETRRAAKKTTSARKTAKKA